MVEPPRKLSIEKNVLQEEAGHGVSEVFFIGASKAREKEAYASISPLAILKRNLLPTSCQNLALMASVKHVPILQALSPSFMNSLYALLHYYHFKAILKKCYRCSNQ